MQIHSGRRPHEDRCPQAKNLKDLLNASSHFQEARQGAPQESAEGMVLTHLVFRSLSLWNLAGKSCRSEPPRFSAFSRLGSEMHTTRYHLPFPESVVHHDAELRRL